MPYRIKMDSKDTLADEAHLLSGMERLVVTLQQYQRQIVVAVVVLVVAIAAVGTIVWMDHRNSEQAVALEQQAARLYLDRPVDQLTTADENLKKAIAIYRLSLDQYPRSPIAPLMLYRLGNALVQANDLDGAINTYQKFIATHGENQTLRALVYQRLGYAFLLKGDIEQARKVFSAVLDMPDSLNKDQILFELGKIEEGQSRPEGALARYQDLMKAYPNSPFTGEAAVRTKALEVKKTPDTPSVGTPDQGTSQSVESPK